MCRLAIVTALFLGLPTVRAQTLRIDAPVSPPAWALLQRQLLKANADACREFFARYFDDRGYLLCVERWGGDDGPDDAIENLTDWPILYALGGDTRVLRMMEKAWEGHLQQFTEARTTHVPFAKDGMYYKEFPVMFDWLHNGEGLSVFNLLGLCDPDGLRFRQRVRRYAGFYMNEDPDAPNYDAKHKIIRSMFNGSRGPLLRKATALDWAGDPIEVGNRFKLGHGERSYDEMLAHFKDYNDIVGDHPQNLLATCLGVNAYMLAHEPKYKQWVLDYVGAWRDRFKDNGGIIPSNVGLDGKIGSAADGKWYGGVYGWGFSVAVPQTGQLAHRNNVYLGFAGFMNAYLLTGDDGFLDPWRKMIDLINSKTRSEEGATLYPHMHGSQGWYQYSRLPFSHGAHEIYWLTMKPSDRSRVPASAWLEYLEGKNPRYPEAALRGDLERLRTRVQSIRKDTTTPDTRLADDPLRLNPASVESMLELAMGGIAPKNRGKLLFARLRYFDPVRRRAGLPEDVAALIEKMTDTTTSVMLVNTNPLAERSVIIQGGAYAEHRFTEAEVGGQRVSVNAPSLRVRLAPGAGATVNLNMARHANQPTLQFPFE
jgi:hypothetical protein